LKNVESTALLQFLQPILNMLLHLIGDGGETLQVVGSCFPCASLFFSSLGIFSGSKLEQSILHHIFLHLISMLRVCVATALRFYRLLHFEPWLTF